ncbi:MAG: hypothetical protein ACUVV6_00355 [Thermoplasmatota archaeon]
MRGHKLTAALLCASLLLATSGCVDIYGLREVLGKKTPASQPVYRERNKVLITHAFDTSLLDPGSWSYAASQQAFIKRGTEWLVVYIDLTIIDLDILPFELPNITDYFQRYLRVEVIESDGTSWLDLSYSATAHENVTAMGPMDGPWSVRVEAAGLGNATLGLQDNFKVMLTVREPG